MKFRSQSTSSRQHQRRITLFSSNSSPTYFPNKLLLKNKYISERIAAALTRCVRRLRAVTPISFWVSALIAVPTGASAENILDVYELAQKNDRTFSAAKNQFEATKQAQRQVKGLYYPTLDFSYEYLDTDQTINRSDNEVFGSGKSQYPTNVINLSLTQPLFRWDYRTERKRANAEVLQGEFQMAEAEQELMLRSAEAYLLALAAQDTLVMAKAEADAVGEQLKLSEKRFEIGMADTGEVNESRARYQLNQAELIQAENAVSDRMEALRVIVGDLPNNLAPLKDEFEMTPPVPQDIDSWMTQAEQNNLGVQSSMAAVDIADAELRRHKADRLPDVDLFANFNNRDAEGSLFGGGSDVDTSDVGVRAQWTLFQGGRLRAKIREAKFNKARAEDELEVTKSNVRREARSAYLGVVSGINRVAALKSSLDAQDMSVKSKTKGFETGTNSNLEVLDAKRDYFFVQRDYLKARYEYLLSMLNLKRMVGSLNPSDLREINSILVGSAMAESISEQSPEEDLIDDIGVAEPMETQELDTASALDSPAVVIIETDSAENEIEIDTAMDTAADTNVELEAETELSIEDDPTMVDMAEEELNESSIDSDAAADSLIESESLDAEEEVAQEAIEEASEQETTEESLEEALEDAPIEQDQSVEDVQAPIIEEPDVSTSLEESAVTPLALEPAEGGEAGSDEMDSGEMPLAADSGEVADALEEVQTDSSDVVEDAEQQIEEPELDSQTAAPVDEQVDLEKEASEAERMTENAAEAELADVEIDPNASPKDQAYQWLSALSKESYTLQLVTTDSQSSCLRTKAGNSNQLVYCFQSSADSSKWFALTGSYESRVAANQAAAEMGKANAWARYTPRIVAKQCSKSDLNPSMQLACR